MEIKMRRNSVAIVLAIAVIGFAGVARAAELAYSEGHVWAITLIHIKPGMLNRYMSEIIPLRKAFVEAAKQQGELIDSHIVLGDASTQEDWNMMIVDVYKNWASMDGLSAKMADLTEKIVGPEAVQVQALNARHPMRDIIGNKTMQEVIPR
jgi:hypothetical protein